MPFPAHITLADNTRLPALEQLLNTRLQLPQISPSIFVPTPHYKQYALSPDLLSKQGWFLNPDSWEIKRTYITSPADPRMVFKDFVNTLKTWLHQFASTGHNVFIHRQIYHPSRGGMPFCIQDAWLTLNAYLAKTEHTQDIIFQILDDRTRKLLLLAQDQKQIDVRSHIARTHALLIYILIGLLFHNPSGQKIEAEECLPVLAAWCHEMRDTAVAEAPTLFSPTTAPDPFFDITNKVVTQEEIEQNSLWNAFIISETVRRTWMIASAALRIFQPCSASRTGTRDSLDLSTVTQNRCLGFLSFTIRAGLWEAETADEWAKLHTRNARPRIQDDTAHQTRTRDQRPLPEDDGRQASSDGQLWEECPKTVITTFIQDMVADTDSPTRGSRETYMSLIPVFLESVAIVDKVLEETRPEEVDSWTIQIFRMGLAGEKIDAWLGKGTLC